MRHGAGGRGGFCGSARAGRNQQNGDSDDISTQARDAAAHVRPVKCNARKILRFLFVGGGHWGGLATVTQPALSAMMKQKNKDLTSCIHGVAIGDVYAF
jgi:hypothetical protein